MQSPNCPDFAKIRTLTEYFRFSTFCLTGVRSIKNRYLQENWTMRPIRVQSEEKSSRASFGLVWNPSRNISVVFPKYFQNADANRPDRLAARIYPDFLLAFKITIFGRSNNVHFQIFLIRNQKMLASQRRSIQFINEFIEQDKKALEWSKMKPINVSRAMKELCFDLAVFSCHWNLFYNACETYSRQLSLLQAQSDA